MLSKCTNPGCSAQFHYFHQGKLFRWETAGGTRDSHPSFGADPQFKAPARRIEYFWLCENCAASMTLAFDRTVGVVVHPFVRPPEVRLVHPLDHPLDHASEDQPLKRAALAWGL
jgi:hypothetical protein